MSDQTPSTTKNGKDDDTAAALTFGAILAAGFGFAGVLIAALAVGCERAWTNRRGGPAQRAARQRTALADHRAWLAQDAKRQQDWRQARREWWAAGGDPATRPNPPPAAQGTGAWWRRRWARTRVGLAEFVAGFMEGWRAATAVKDGGGRFRDIVRARPAQKDEPDSVVHDDCTYCLGCDKCRPAKHGWSCPRCGVRREGFATAEAAKADSKIRCCGDGPQKSAERSRGGEQCPACRGWGNFRPTREEWLTEDQKVTVNGRLDLNGHYTFIHRSNGSPTCPQRGGDNTETPATSDGPNTQGEPMTAPTQTPATSSGAATESNAAIMAQRLAEVEAGNQQIEELTDQLAALRNQQALRVQNATEFAESTGQSAATRQALDASTAVVESIGQQVGSVSDAVVEAGDQVNAAHQGLQPVIQAEDALTAAGADGRAVAPATAD